MATIQYYQGHDTYVMYDEETSYGAGASASAKIGKVTNASVNMTNNFLRTQSLGDGRNAQVAVTGPFDISGSVDWQVDDLTFMQYAIGDLSGAGTIGDPYELQEKENIGYTAGTNIPSLAFEFGSEGGSNDDVSTVSGIVIDTLTINLNQGEVMTATCDWIGKTIATSTTLSSYTASTNKPFVFQQGGVSIGGETFDLMNFSLTIANNIQTYRNVGSRLIQQPTTGLRRYDFTLTFKFKYDDSASLLSGTELRNYFLGATAAPATSASVTSYALNVSVDEGANSGDRVVDIDLENCYFESWSQPMPLEGGVFEITVNGFGLAGKTDGAAKVPIRWYEIA